MLVSNVNCITYFYSIIKRNLKMFYVMNTASQAKEVSTSTVGEVKDNFNCKAIIIKKKSKLRSVS